MTKFTPEFKATVGLLVLLVLFIGIILNQVTIQREVTILEHSVKPVVIKEVVTPVPSATPSASVAPLKQSIPVKSPSIPVSLSPSK